MYQDCTLTAICSRCGRETEVPFQPNGNKPVYCKECYRSVMNG